MKHLWYGLGIIVSVAALVAVQVVPHLEQYTLEEGGSPVPADSYGGASWRLISLAPATGENLPKGTAGVTAVIGVTPKDQAASKAMAQGCSATVRDRADRVWSPSRAVQGLPGLASVCMRLNKPVLVPPGTELKWQASFAVPIEAVSSLQVEVRVQKTEGFVRLTPAAAPSGRPQPAG
ncbi:hypothetical protein [Nonomuraea sp. SYSU D8015]|uniref:hypothetical protein n=1 Tax=Nonomuraea sp. SYSU D8015 TaxID=2593644 RepID=UPI0016604FF9|nr:hypothetical protein [Nonomuraea sp. SYSU D8015]